MKNIYYLVVKEEIDPNLIIDSNKNRRIVSFSKSVLDKYVENKNDFIIEMDQQNDPVALKSEKDGWLLQIDVGSEHVSTWLYQLGRLPDEEQRHFIEYNINPRELSSKADRRWNGGLP